MRLTALLRRFISAPEFGPLVLLAVEILVFTVRSPAFLSASNISNLLAFTPELGMITLGMTLLMTAGEFDLSVGSVFGFAPIMMWTFYNAHVGPLEVGFLFAMVISALIGFINGWMVTRLRIHRSWSRSECSLSSEAPPSISPTDSLNTPGPLTPC